MQPTHGRVGIVVAGARWAFPWLGAFAASGMSVMKRSGRELAPHMVLALPWIGLLIAMSTITYGLNLFATALGPAPSEVSVTQTKIDDAQDNVALLDDALLERSGSPVQAAAADSRWTVVTITGLEMSTGAERVQVHCVANANRVSGDALLVDLTDFSAVVSTICNSQPTGE